MKRLSILFCFVAMFVSGLSQASDFTVGYVPVTFPRDPINVNQFDEHVILGQILEPLVDTDGDGKLIPAIARSWQFSSNGKRLIFEISDKLKFSDGRRLVAKDIVYSLKRHLNSDSQSKNFLTNVRDVKLTSEGKVEVLLERRDVSILKALSRDQLGIVPEGWTFDPTSNTPFNGTGAYVLKKNGNQWYLVVNEFYQNPIPAIKKWRLLFFKDASFNIPEEVPNLTLDITVGVLNQIKLLKSFDSAKLNVSTNLSFTQTSLWVHPKSTFYSDPKKRRLTQLLLNSIISDYCEKSNLTRATGIIPLGIQGSLSTPFLLERFEKSREFQTIRIAAPAGMFSSIFSNEMILKYQEKFGVKFEVFFRSPGEFKKMHEWGPDVVAGSWAGGFNDPAGFLSLLPSILGVDFFTYLGKHGTLLSETQGEEDWNKRAKLFEQISSIVLSERLLTPGWRVPTFETRTPKIVRKAYQTRYTPRLTNFESKDLDEN